MDPIDQPEVENNQKDGSRQPIEITVTNKTSKFTEINKSIIKTTRI